MKRGIFLFFGLLLALGCRPKIGDSCIQNIDCSPDGTAGRICDVTSPNGYCTFASCTAASSPKAASSVSFRDGDFTFCMLACSSPDECRQGYDCVPPDPASGLVILDAQPRDDGATGFCG